MIPSVNIRGTATTQTYNFPLYACELPVCHIVHTAYIGINRSTYLSLAEYKHFHNALLLFACLQCTPFWTYIPRTARYEYKGQYIKHFIFCLARVW